MKRLYRYFLAKHRDRRGVALALALILLMVALALCTSLVTSAVLLNRMIPKTDGGIPQSVQLDRMGEDFCRAVRNGEEHTWKNAYPEYDIRTAELTLQVREEDTGRILLMVELARNGDGTYTVTKWQTN